MKRRNTSNIDKILVIILGSVALLIVSLSAMLIKNSYNITAKGTNTINKKENTETATDPTTSNSPETTTQSSSETLKETPTIIDVNEFTSKVDKGEIEYNKEYQVTATLTTKELWGWNADGDYYNIYIQGENPDGVIDDFILRTSESIANNLKSATQATLVLEVKSDDFVYIKSVAPAVQETASTEPTSVNIDELINLYNLTTIPSGTKYQFVAEPAYQELWGYSSDGKYYNIEVKGSTDEIMIKTDIQTAEKIKNSTQVKFTVRTEYISDDGIPDLIVESAIPN